MLSAVLAVFVEHDAGHFNSRRFVVMIVHVDLPGLQVIRDHLGEYGQHGLGVRLDLFGRRCRWLRWRLQLVQEPLIQVHAVRHPSHRNSKVGLIAVVKLDASPEFVAARSLSSFALRSENLTF